MRRAALLCTAVVIGSATMALAQNTQQSVFDRLDTNRDGWLSAEELAATPRAAGDDLFKNLDRDSDGFVSRAEFDAFAARRGQLSAQPARELRAALPILREPEVSEGTPAEIARYRDAAAYSAANGGLVLLVMKEGRAVFEQHIEGSTPEKAYQIASGTKSFWGPLAAVAIQDGLFSLDELVADTLTEWKTDPRKSRMTVREMLTFSSGLESPRRLWAERDKNLYTLALGLAAVEEPGKRFTYSEVHLYAFGEFLNRKLAARAAKIGPGIPETAHEYLERTLLKPVGIAGGRWHKDATGQPAMGDGAVLTARQWAAWGELIRNRGKHGDTQLIPADGLAKCFESSTANAAYGMTWWLNKPSNADLASMADRAGERRRRSSDQVSERGIVSGRLPDLVMAAGAGQQRLYVLPSEELVIVRFANADMPAAVMRGEYNRLNLNFKDEEFFTRLLAPAGTERTPK